MPLLTRLCAGLASDSSEEQIPGTHNSKKRFIN
jgi:hypothetical protein